MLFSPLKDRLARDDETTSAEEKPSNDTVRVKGAPDVPGFRGGHMSTRVLASVVRDGRVTLSEIGLNTLPRLRVGDTLQIRLLGADPRGTVSLLSADGTTIYEGTVNKDGWLPQGFQVTPEPRVFRYTPLRFVRRVERTVSRNPCP